MVENAAVGDAFAVGFGRRGQKRGEKENADGELRSHSAS
jgi:hypothetical protein